MMKSLLFALVLTLTGVGTASSQSELSTYITNGTTTSTVTYSDFVSLFYKLDQDTRVPHSLCGATMLNDQYVLTAAHCIFFNSKPNTEFMLFMVIGQTDDESNWFSNSTATVQASEFYYDNTFSDSQSDLWENDIAIIKLASPINVSSYVIRPASQNDYRDVSNTFVTVGHGNTSRNTSTNQLYEAPLTYVENADCASSTAGLNGLHNSQICFTSPTSTSTTGLINGVCSGDSGGPVYWDDGGTLTQVGITSFGPTNCGVGLGTKKITGVFTEIADYDLWINNVLNGSIAPQYIATDAKRTAYYNDLKNGIVTSFLSTASKNNAEISPASDSGGAAGGLLLLAVGGLLGRCRNRRR